MWYVSFLFYEEVMVVDRDAYPNNERPSSISVLSKKWSKRGGANFVEAISCRRAGIILSLSTQSVIRVSHVANYLSRINTPPFFSGS